MKNIIKFSRLEGKKGVIHGFSTKFYGDMSSKNTDNRRNLKNFAMDLGIDPLNTVDMEQVHGENVQWVTRENLGWKMLQADALITNKQNVFLVVKCADCFPVFIIDKKTSRISAIHAGWRGVYNGIIGKAIEEFINNGVSPRDLTAYIGPGIRQCCYAVDAGRAEMFRDKFEDSGNAVIEKKGKLFISLPEIIKKQVIGMGASAEDIEDCGVCTFDNHDLYSYRREGIESGRFIGIIGII